MLHRNVITGAVVMLVVGIAVHVEGSFECTPCEHYRDGWLYKLLQPAMIQSYVSFVPNFVEKLALAFAVITRSQNLSEERALLQQGVCLSGISFARLRRGGIRPALRMGRAI